MRGENWSGVRSSPGFPRLEAEKLMISSKDLLEACQKGTCRRCACAHYDHWFSYRRGSEVDLVERGLRSFAANAKRHGRTVEFLVADSSARIEHRDAFNAAACEKWRRNSG